MWDAGQGSAEKGKSKEEQRILEEVRDLGVSDRALHSSPFDVPPAERGSISTMP